MNIIPHCSSWLPSFLLCRLFRSAAKCMDFTERLDLDVLIYYSLWRFRQYRYPAQFQATFPHTAIDNPRNSLSTRFTVASEQFTPLRAVLFRQPPVIHRIFYSQHQASCVHRHLYGSASRDAAAEYRISEQTFAEWRPAGNTASR